MCPEGCPEAQQIACQDMTTEIHACCIDNFPFCFELTYAQCVAINGTFLWHEDECNEYVCGVGCRVALGYPYVPTDGPEWGQKEYTEDICYPAPMKKVHPPYGHYVNWENYLPGRGMFVTAHEVRAVSQSGDDDPCALAYGVLARGEHSRRRPYLCSRPHPTDTLSAAYSQGFFAKSPDNDGVVPRGRRFARCGVRTEPNREVQFYHPQLICGGID